ncbi:hypothetical protein [Amedibacillus sp. YH-ame10]
MKKILMSLICCLMITSIVGCSSNRNKDIEEIFLNNNYYIDCTESGIAIKNYYKEGFGGRIWAHTDSGSNIIFTDDYILEDVIIDPVNEKLNSNSSKIPEEFIKEEIKELKRLSDTVLKSLNISYDELLEYMEYKMKNDPKSVGDNNNTPIENLPDKKTSKTKMFYNIATSITKDDLKRDKLGLYSLGDITLTSNDCEWIDNPLNKKGSVNQGAFYRKMATSLEGFKLGFNNGISITQHILGEIALNGTVIRPRVDELSSYIVEKDSLKPVMNKFKSLSTITGTINVDANSYDFTITDLTACTEELKISEEMLGYILAMLDEYAPTVSFDGNSYTFRLN